MYTHRSRNARFNGRKISHGSFRNNFRGQGRGARPEPSIDAYIARASVKSQTIEAPAQQVRFDTLDLPQTIQQTILRHGYAAMTPIQAAAIPAIRAGKDVTGIANTGTGKTAAFLIPLVEKILKDRTYRALIIAPTRELALQIQDELRKFSLGMPISNAFCIGKSSMYNQIRQLQRKPHVVIGTPGRLKDLIERKALQLNSFRMVVLDEADQMLDMGFIHDVRHIISFLSPSRQSLFFSATVSPAINTLIASFVKNPVTVSVKKQETVSHIKQDVIRVPSNLKLGTLISLLSKEEFKKVLVFGRTKRRVDKISRELYEKGLRVGSIHGDKPQQARQKALRMFKEDVVNVLIATDVAARGLDINNVTHVINYDVPESYEDYIHRIGRTGRANNAGTAITFAE